MGKSSSSVLLKYFGSTRVLPQRSIKPSYIEFPTPIIYWLLCCSGSFASSCFVCGSLGRTISSACYEFFLGPSSGGAMHSYKSKSTQSFIPHFFWQEQIGTAGRIPFVTSLPRHNHSNLDNMRISAIHIIIALSAGAWAAPSVSTLEHISNCQYQRIFTT